MAIGIHEASIKFDDLSLPGSEFLILCQDLRRPRVPANENTLENGLLNEPSLAVNMGSQAPGRDVKDSRAPVFGGDQGSATGTDC